MQSQNALLNGIMNTLFIATNSYIHINPQFLAQSNIRAFTLDMAGNAFFTQSELTITTSLATPNAQPSPVTSLQPVTSGVSLRHERILSAAQENLQISLNLSGSSQ